MNTTAMPLYSLQRTQNTHGGNHFRSQTSPFDASIDTSEPLVVLKCSDKNLTIVRLVHRDSRDFFTENTKVKTNLGRYTDAPLTCIYVELPDIHLLDSLFQELWAILCHEIKPINSEVNLRIEKRLKELEDIGKEEELPMSENSKVELMEFISKLRPSNYPLISMLDNGTLRAVWQHQDGRQIGLLFFGTGEVEYVIFRERKPDGSRNTEFGTTSIDQAYAIISRSGLKVLHTA